MDMEESAEENSNAAGEQYEEEIIPKVITDEVFEEVSQRTNLVIRDLQIAKLYSASEDVQKLLLVCQNLRQNIVDEKERIEQMKGEVNNAQARVQNVLKASVQDQEAIQQLKSEIGNEKERERSSATATVIKPFYVFLPLSPHQTKRGRTRMLQCCVNKSLKRR
jgi:Zn-dependent metalloprotease